MLRGLRGAFFVVVVVHDFLEVDQGRTHVLYIACCPSSLQ